MAPSPSPKTIQDVKRLSIVASLVSIPVLGMGIWLATKSHAGFNSILQWPLICIGTLLFLLPFFGFYLLTKEAERTRSCCPARDKHRWKWGLFIGLVSNLLSALFSFTVFAFYAARGGGGIAEPGRTFLEYRLSDYSVYLQDRVGKESTWDQIKTTLIHSNLCNSLPELYSTLDAFNLAKLTPVESGCCKPPMSCKYSFVTPIHWKTTRTTKTPSEDLDCRIWSNKKLELCFGCTSCKAGFIHNVKVDWHKASIVNIIMCTLLIIVNIRSFFLTY